MSSSKHKRRHKKLPDKKYFEKDGLRYYPEETLIELVQDGIFDWVDYVIHYSPEWHDEYIDFCRELQVGRSNQTALAYIAFREDRLEEEMERGNA